MKPTFSLIIPCYNEAANLPILLPRCSLATKDNRIEVILVDNGSTDDSPRLLNELIPMYVGCRSIRVPTNHGYGFGILSGLRAAHGDILGWTHADMQVDPQDILHGLGLFEEFGLNIFVKGRRFGRPASDIFFTICMSAFESALLGKRLWDINAQPTLFSRCFFETWRNPPNDFSLDLYAYYKARRSGLPVYRFPVRFGERAHGVSHWNVSWSAKMRFICRTLDYSFRLRRELDHR